jgi:hypothetical protein
MMMWKISGMDNDKILRKYDSSKINPPTSFINIFAPKNQPEHINFYYEFWQLQCQASKHSEHP